MALQFPNDIGTFKKSFLSGDGNLELDNPGEAWQSVVASGGFFTPDITNIATLKVALNTKPLQLGEPGGLKFNVGVTAASNNQIELIWPGVDNPVLTAFGLQSLLTPGKVYAHVLLSGTADATASGAFPIGPLTNTTFSIGGGGNVAFEFLKLYDPKALNALELLRDLLGSLRFPQKIGHVAEIPAAGEVSANRYGGYLKLNGAVSWGYSFSGSQAFSLPSQLKLQFDYKLQLMAAATIGYQIAGDFSIEARRGSQPNWVRFVVRKNRTSQFDFAADFSLDAQADLNGLPPSADDFLSKLLGSDAQTVLGTLSQATNLSTVAALEADVGKYLDGFVLQLADPFIGKVLNDSVVKEFLAKAKQVLDAYDNVDQTIIHLYEEYLGKIPELTTVINDLAAITTRDGLQQIAPDSGAWAVIQKLWSGPIFDLLLKQEAFQEYSKKINAVKDFLDNGPQEIKQFIAKLKSEFPLDQLFQKLSQMDAQGLQNLADTKLQGLVEKIIGKAFEELQSVPDFTKAIQTVHSTLQKIQDFKTTWYAKLTKAVHQSFALQLHYAYSRAAKNAELLDLEIDLSNPAGPALASAASRGDFAGALEQYRAVFVKINSGVFTHSVARSAQLHINLFGRQFDSLVQVIHNAQDAIQEQPGGLLHVYTTKDSIQESKKNKAEQIQSNLALSIVGQASQAEGSPAPVLEAIHSMGVEYSLVQNSDRPTVKRLTQFLEMAEFLHIIPDRNAFVKDLSTQFPSGLGKVSLSYAVNFDTADLGAAFKISSPVLRKQARDALRSLIAARYLTLDEPFWAARAFCFIDDGIFQQYFADSQAFLTAAIVYTEPAWFNGTSKDIRRQLPFDLLGAAVDVNRLALSTLFNIQLSYEDALVKLAELASSGQPVPIADLDRASAKFVSMAADVDRYKANAFFCVLDSLVRQATGPRPSALMMQITPPGGKMVTKILTEPNRQLGAAIAESSGQ
ncbi:MAG TPA: hypothetical protein VIX89_13130 [Bryobacteraceae bacterium]